MAVAVEGKYPQTMPMKTTAQIKRNSLPTTGCTNPSRSAGGKRIVTHVLTAAIRPARRLARTRPTFSPEKPPAGGAGPPSRRSGPTPHFPWPIFWGLRFLEFLGIADALGSC